MSTSHRVRPSTAVVATLAAVAGVALSVAVTATHKAPAGHGHSVGYRNSHGSVLAGRIRWGG